MLATLPSAKNSERSAAAIDARIAWMAAAKPASQPTAVQAQIVTVTDLTNTAQVSGRTIVTVAGHGAYGSSGEGLPALVGANEESGAVAVSVSPSGDLYIVDQRNNDARDVHNKQRSRAARQETLCSKPMRSPRRAP
ncbi:MAG TPA: hypothetical protein VMV68_00535 [Spirochaetia bacterium]|nr:hypothetical protein [Spirochaetia bacterium]